MSQVKEKFLEKAMPVAHMEVLVFMADFYLGLYDSNELFPEEALLSTKAAALHIVQESEKLGLVNRRCMKNSGILPRKELEHWNPEPALRHVRKRLQRALNILKNLNGYESPKKPLYGGCRAGVPSEMFEPPTHD